MIGLGNQNPISRAGYSCDTIDNRTGAASTQRHSRCKPVLFSVLPASVIAAPRGLRSDPEQNNSACRIARTLAN